MYPESVQRFRDEDMRKSKAYSMARESFFTRRAVVGVRSNARTAKRGSQRELCAARPALTVAPRF